MTSRGSAYITGTSSFLPNAPVANDDIENVLGMIAGKPSRARRIVLRNNGIRSRHYAIDPTTGAFTHSNAQLAAAALRGLDLANVEVLACGTSCADQLMPGHAVMVHGELGIPPCEVVSTAGICAAGMGALKYAYLSVLAGQAKKALASGSERASGGLLARLYEPESAHRVAEMEDNPEIAFEKDFLRWMLSDGAGAFLVEDQPRPDGLSLHIDWIDLQSQADSMPVCMYAGGDKGDDGRFQGWQEFAASQWAARSIFSVKQDVRLLNEAIVEQTFGKSLAVARARHGLAAEAVDWFLPHMSSEYFRQPLAA
jgi:3-oxoacyl-[acyl-carrier-protein] synthase-3